MLITSNSILIMLVAGNICASGCVNLQEDSKNPTAMVTPCFDSPKAHENMNSVVILTCDLPMKTNVVTHSFYR